MRAEVLLGDARDVLATLDDASVDAVVTDPPYALTATKGGTKGFMGATWDHGQVAHDPAFWAEVLRVAKPGAHLVAFGGTRTAHRLACAIEDAGWEIRDSLYLLWCHGQGFPKSLDVSKAIDKMAGAARQSLGPRRYADGTQGHWGLSDKYAQDSHTRSLVGGTPKMDTVPATPEAQRWDGWGTALKPAAEPIVLARKPLAESTVAANVLAHGTGALHIDACRVPTGEDTARPNNGTALGLMNDDGWQPQAMTTAGHAGGRWPSNLVLSHVGGPGGCQPAGVRRVRGPQGGVSGRKGSREAVGGYGHDAVPIARYADADGYETAPAWTCHPQCPIHLLDAQAGPRTSKWGKQGERGATGMVLGPQSGAQLAGRTERFIGDTGSASRFFPTFGPDPADAVPFRYQPKASRRDRGDGNTHSTVKPTNLMAWLCRLATPEGGVVLDCFCGSGSTGVACVREGFGFVGIEMSEEYVEIARRRIAHEQEQRSGPLFAGVGTATTAAR